MADLCGSEQGITPRHKSRQHPINLWSWLASDEAGTASISLA